MARPTNRPQPPVRPGPVDPDRPPLTDRQIPGLGRLRVDAERPVVVAPVAGRPGRFMVAAPAVSAAVDGEVVWSDDVRLVGVSDLWPDPDGDVVVVEEVPTEAGDPIRVEHRYRHDLDAVIAAELTWLAEHQARKAAGR